MRTEIPGPKSRAFLERRRAVVSRAIGVGIPICVQSAHGSTITDVDGNTFIDFGGGVRYAPTTKFGLIGALRVNLSLGGNGLIPTVGPELSAQMGF